MKRAASCSIHKSTAGEAAAMSKAQQRDPLKILCPSCNRACPWGQSQLSHPVLMAGSPKIPAVQQPCWSQTSWSGGNLP